MIFVLLKLIVNLLYLGVYTFGYYLGTRFFNLMIGVEIDIPIIQLAFGIMGFGAVSHLFNKPRMAINALIKYCYIYSLSHNNIGFTESFKGVLKNFKGTFGIILADKIIKDTVEALVKDLGKSNGFRYIYGFLEKIPGFTLASKLLDKITRVQYDYLDEYVLYFYYKHQDPSMFKGIRNGFVSYIKNTGNVIGSIVTSSVINFIISVIVRVAIIGSYIYFFNITILGVFWVMLVLGLVMPIIVQEVLLDSILLVNILKASDKIKISEEDVNSYSKSYFNMLEELDRIQIGGSV